MDRSDIITLLIFGGIFIFNLISNLSKKENRGQSNTNEDREADSMKDIFGNQEIPSMEPSKPVNTFGQHRRGVAPEHTHPTSSVHDLHGDNVPVREIKDNSRPFVAKRNKKTVGSAFLSGEEGVSAIEIDNKEMAAVEDENALPAVDLHFDDMDEVRCAFIYSEVFAKKF